jgi:preprotein translocase subunit YajC
MIEAKLAQSCAWFVFFMIAMLFLVIRHDIKKEKYEDKS